MVDIARPESVKRKKKIRRIVYGAAGLVAIALITLASRDSNPPPRVSSGQPSGSTR